MYTTGFPNCCTAIVLCHLSSINTKQVNNTLDDCKRNGYAIVVATTTTAQRKANKVLEECGFKYSVWGGKTRHSNTKLRLWYKVLSPVSGRKTCRLKKSH